MSLKKLFALDLRSLALVRFLLGVVTFFYFFERLFYAKAFYSFDGIIGVAEMDQYFGPIEKFNLYYYFGSTTFVMGTFILAMVASCLFAIGYRTKWQNIFLWFLLIQVQHRFSLSLNGGDILLPLLYFWSFFLPMDRVWSWEKGYQLGEWQETLEFEYLSLYNIAWFFQAFVIYFATAFYKWHPYWHSTGEAMHYALQLDTFTTSIGRWLSRQGYLLPLMSKATFLIELVGPFGLFIPFKRDLMRMGTITLFLGLHVGILLTFDLGLFPFTCMVLWLPFLPSSFWEHFIKKRKESYSLYYDKNCQYCRRMVNLLNTFFMVSGVRVFPSSEREELHEKIEEKGSWCGENEKGEVFLAWDNFREVLSFSALPFIPKILRLIPTSFGTKVYYFVAKRRAKLAPLLKFAGAGSFNVKGNFSKIFFLLCVFGALYFNLTGFDRFKDIRLKGWSHNAIHIFGLDQRWSMFGPYPATAEGWPVLKGKFQNGGAFDPWRKKEVSFESPKDIKLEYSSILWRKSWERLSTSSGYRAAFVRFLCREWNGQISDKSKKMRSIRVFYMIEHSPKSPSEEAQIEKKDLGSYGCL